MLSVFVFKVLDTVCRREHALNPGSWTGVTEGDTIQRKLLTSVTKRLTCSTHFRCIPALVFAKQIFHGGMVQSQVLKPTKSGFPDMASPAT